MTTPLGRWFDRLVDPIDRQPLRLEGGVLVAANGIRYPVVDGIPVLLRPDLRPTHRGSARTLKLAGLALQGVPIDLVTAVNLSEAVKAKIRREIDAGSDPAEAVIRCLAPMTNGFAYRKLALGDPIAIPKFPSYGTGELLLDVGCSWGRWTIAASQSGFRAIGLDPMLGPLLAAKHFAATRGVDVDYVCGDARCLPFADGIFDRAFSYSTLQHFSNPDCLMALGELGRVLKPGGASTLQLASRSGVRSLWHQMRRGFRSPVRFEVRYRSLRRMLTMCNEAIGPTTVSIDCFFGLGLQASDMPHMRPLGRVATRASERLKRCARTAPWLCRFADSLFFHSIAKAA